MATFRFATNATTIVVPLVAGASFDYANKHRRFIDVSPILHTDQNPVYDPVSLNTRYVRTQRARCYILFTLDPLTNAYFRVISRQSRPIRARAYAFVFQFTWTGMRTVYYTTRRAEASSLSLRPRSSRSRLNFIRQLHDLPAGKI